MVPFRSTPSHTRCGWSNPTRRRLTAFQAESVSQIDEDDLWIPLVHTAA